MLQGASRMNQEKRINPTPHNVIKENRELTEENINLRNENEILKEKVKKFNREKFELPKNSKEKVDNKNGRK